MSKPRPRPSPAAAPGLGIVIPPGLPGLGINLAAVGLAEIEPTPATLASEQRRFVIDIEGFRPPTLNELMRGKLRARMSLAKRSDLVIATACRNYGLLTLAMGKRRVSLVVGLGPGRREFDVDAPWKGLLDSLKNCGAIVDDKVKWCEIGSLAFYRRPEGDHTRIILEDREANPDA